MLILQWVITWEKSKKFPSWKENKTELEVKPFLPEALATFPSRSLSPQQGLKIPHLLPGNRGWLTASATWQESLTPWWDTCPRGWPNRVATCHTWHVSECLWPWPLSQSSHSEIDKKTPLHTDTNRSYLWAFLVTLVSLWRHSTSSSVSRELRIVEASHRFYWFKILVRRLQHGIRFDVGISCLLSFMVCVILGLSMMFTFRWYSG